MVSKEGMVKMISMKLILYCVTLLLASMCFGYLQLAYNSDLGRRPVWTYSKNKPIWMVILLIDVLVFIPTVIWGIKYWLISLAIVTTLLCAFVGMTLEIQLEHTNKQRLLIIPMFLTPILGILLWVL